MYYIYGARGGTVGSGTGLLGSTPDGVIMVSLEVFIDIILPAALWPLRSTQPLTAVSTWNISQCKGLTPLPTSCTRCLNTCEPQLPGTIWA
jgi:hypothetical protein